jgi:hypothetical protein
MPHMNPSLLVITLKKRHITLKKRYRPAPQIRFHKLINQFMLLPPHFTYRFGFSRRRFLGRSSGGHLFAVPIRNRQEHHWTNYARQLAGRSIGAVHLEESTTLQLDDVALFQQFQLGIAQHWHFGLMWQSKIRHHSAEGTLFCEQLTLVS